MILFFADLIQTECKVLTAERMLIVWKKQSKESKYSPDIQYSVRFCIFCWKEDKLGSIFSG